MPTARMITLIASASSANVATLADQISTSHATRLTQ